MQIEHEDLSSGVYKRLKDMILGNEFLPGQQLKQEHLAAMFGISRMPLHKAFQMLEDEMLVERRPRRGFFVTIIDELRLYDAFEVRAAVEGVAARRAAKEMSSADIVYLRKLFKPFSDKTDINLRQYAKADQAFHDHILKQCGNMVLGRLEIISNITQQTYRGGLIRTPVETLPEHLAIIDALERGDGKTAEKLARAHSQKTCKILQKQMKKK
jgi:DNA-binding GntR family transcriptional regulator